MSEKQKVGPAVAIKRFFELDNGKKVGMEEMQKLSGDERKALGKMCADALGVELDIPA